MRSPIIEDPAPLTAETLVEALAEGQLNSVLLEGADLGQMRAEPLELVDARLRDVELSNARLRRILARRAEFTDCRGIGLRLDAERATDVHALRCRFDYAHIHIERAKGPIVFEGCSLRESVLSGDLSTAVFTDCELAGAEFDARDASGCDLRGSRITDIRGLLTLRGAIVDTGQVIAAATRIATAAGFDVRE